MPRASRPLIELPVHLHQASAIGTSPLSIITETVFHLLLGFLFIQAVQFVDVPVMAAYLCMVAFVFVTINLLVDLLYYAVDPRLTSTGPVRQGRAG